MNVTWYLSDLHACGHLRGELPAREINKNSSNVNIQCKRDMLMSDMYRTNIAVFQRQASAPALERAKAMKDRGMKLVYDLDDDVFNIPKEFEKPYNFYSDPAVQQTVKNFFAISDAVTVSTNRLAQAIQPLTSGTPIFVMPNALSVDHLGSQVEYQKSRESSRVTVGWFASGSHKYDAEVMAGAVKRVLEECPNVDFSFVGLLEGADFEAVIPNIAEYVKSKRVIFMEWLETGSLDNWIANLDIGIAPIREHPFNNSKSDVKWMHYSSIGVPSICSDTGPYKDLRHGGNALLAATEDDWIGAIQALAIGTTGAQLRQKIGASARREILENHNISKTYQDWVRFYVDILART